MTKGRHRKGPAMPGRHETPRDRQCSYSWTTDPQPGLPAGLQHIDHMCCNANGHTGQHLCRNWSCGETHA